MTTTQSQAIEGALELLAELKAAYRKKRADEAAALRTQVETYTALIRTGIRVAIREDPRIALLTPFVKLDDIKAPDDGSYVAKVTATVDIPAHAPIYLHFEQSGEKTWRLGMWKHSGYDRQVEITVWAHWEFNGEWDLGQILSRAEDNFPAYAQESERSAETEKGRGDGRTDPETT